jgi:hypothetical protein
MAGIKDGSLSATDVLPAVADKFAGMTSQAERTAYSMKIFGRQGADLIPLLEGGAGGLDKLTARFHELGGGMDENFIAKAKDAGKAMSGMRFTFEAFKRQIAVQFFPAVAAFGKKMQSLGAFINGVTKETEVASYAFVVLGAAASAAGLKAFAGWARFLGILPKGGSIWKTLFNMGELGLIIAGVVILALAFEDFFTFLRGGESIVGDLIEKFVGFGEAKTLLDELRGAWELISGLFAQDLGTLQPVIDLLKSAADGVLPYIVASFVDIVKIIAAAVVGLAALTKGFLQLTRLDFDGLKKTADATITTLFGDKGLLSNSAVGNQILRKNAKADAEDRFGKDRPEQAWLSPQTYAPLGAAVTNLAPGFQPTQAFLPGSGGAPAQAGGVTQTNNNDIRVTVNGGQTNAETGAVVGRAVRDGVTQADLQQARAAFSLSGD